MAVRVGVIEFVIEVKRLFVPHLMQCSTVLPQLRIYSMIWMS